jgi:hypothetical protein
MQINEFIQFEIRTINKSKVDPNTLQSRAFVHKLNAKIADTFFDTASHPLTA